MIVRRRRSLQAKATSYVLVAVLRFFIFTFFYFFFTFDATAQQRLGGFSPNLLCGVIRQLWYSKNWG